MTYLPTEYINSNYKYTVSNGVIRVITNNNCYQNYNTTYCDCYDIYLNNDYLSSNAISCSYTPNTYLTSEKFTDDIRYRVDFDNILIMVLILSIFIVYVPTKILLRFFRRFQ